MQYPVHTLAPDPRQRELDLRPMKKAMQRDPHQQKPQRVLCRFCGGVHASQKEVLQCKDGC